MTGRNDLFLAIRNYELEQARRLMPPASRLLEVGGGNGYQARALRSFGYDVSSVDIPGSMHDAKFFEVARYDGRNLPFADESFDVVFSSNVLEHVSDLPYLLAEMRRVLRPGGVAVHLMPSASWRVWTTISYYASFALRALSRGERPSEAEDATHIRAPKAPRPAGETPIGRARRLAVAEPHGEFPSAAAELHYFRRRRWAGFLRSHGFEVLAAEGNGLFYTGYLLFPGLRIGPRRALSRLFGSSCSLYLTRPSSR